MGQLELFDHYMDTLRRLYSFDTILKKAKTLFSEGTFTRPGGSIPLVTKTAHYLCYLQGISSLRKIRTEGLCFST